MRKALSNLRSEGFDIRGFGDMSIKEVKELTGLGTDEAEMAKQRDFDEPFVFTGGKKELRRLLSRIKSRGLNYTQGVFFHIMGDSDKGKAVKVLKELYARQSRNIVTAGLGDSLNDIEMLENVDYPVVVQNSEGFYDRRIKLKRFIKAEGIGPEGWNRAVKKLLETLFY